MKLAPAVLLFLCATARAEDPAPVLALRAESGGFEEAFALDGAGGRLALVRADGEGQHSLELIDVDQKGAVLLRVPLGAAAPSSVALSPAGLLIVTATADGSAVEAALHEPGGKPARRLGPASDIVFSSLADKETVALFTRRDGSLEIAHVDPKKDRPVVQRTLALDAAGEIAALELAPRYWRGGYTQLVGRRRGRYDKKRDRQMNDTEAVYDVARGAIVRDLAPTDLVAWTRIQNARARRDNVETFVFADGPRLSVVTGDDKIVPLDLPLTVYDVASLAQQALADGRIIFSLTVDPLNPEALARQKRDPERIHVYRFEPVGGGKVERLLDLPRAGRDFVWRASATRLALLRKHKAYGRGGAELDVYEWR